MIDDGQKLQSLIIRRRWELAIVGWLKLMFFRLAAVVAFFGGIVP